MKRYTLKVPPGENLQLQIVGDYVRVESSTVTVILEEPDSAQVVYLAEGDDTKLKKFRRMYVRHDDGATQTIVLSVGDGTQKSSARVGGTVSVSVASSVVSSPDVSVAAATTALVTAINLSRREVMVTSAKSNTADLRVGDAAIGAARGVPLYPGDTVTLSTTAAIYVYNSHATVAQSVAISQVVT